MKSQVTLGGQPGEGEDVGGPKIKPTDALLCLPVPSW